LWLAIKKMLVNVFPSLYLKISHFEIGLWCFLGFESFLLFFNVGYTNFNCPFCYNDSICFTIKYRIIVLSEVFLKLWHILISFVHLFLFINWIGMLCLICIFVICFQCRINRFQPPFFYFITMTICKCSKSLLVFLYFFL